METNWVLASKTGFAQITHIRAQSYYGAATDIGTPGFRAGSALPVKLSHSVRRVIKHRSSRDYLGNTVRVEQRWILYQAEQPERWRVQGH